MVCHHIGQSSGSSTQSPNSGQVPDFGRKKFAIEGERKPSALIAVGFLLRNAGDDASCANPSTSAAATLSGDSHAFRGWRSGGGTTRRMFHRAIPNHIMLHKRYGLPNECNQKKGGASPLAANEQI